MLSDQGAIGISGPSLTGLDQILLNSSTGQPQETVTAQNVTTTSTFYIGPQTIMVGDEQSQSFFILAGGTNLDILTTTDTYIDRTITTTATYLNTSTYQLVGHAIVPVAFDILPGRCPNPLAADAEEKNTQLAAAVLGSASLDVSQIDPASIQLQGVPALSPALKDVATPYKPFIGKQKATDCTKAGRDGFRDLTLKFNQAALVKALGRSNRLIYNRPVVVHLTGKLFDGTPIIGEDVMVIIKEKDDD